MICVIFILIIRIGGGDYIEFNLDDTISGQIQGWKPLSDEEVEEICIGKQK